MITSWYLNTLVNLIMSKYFNDTICIMYTFDRNKDIVHLSTVPVILTQDVDNFQLDSQQICKNFLIQCENASSALYQVERVIRIDSDGMYNDRKYVIIVDNQEEFDIFFNISTLTFVRDILIVFILENQVEDNKLLLPLDNSLEVRLYTHKYVGIEDNNNPVLLDIWFAQNQSFKFNFNLFPDKVTDQQGRELRAPCMTRFPFAYCDLG